MNEETLMSWVQHLKRKSRNLSLLQHGAALDRATYAVTGRDWADLLRSVTWDGYVPTLNLSWTKGQVERKAVRLLRHELHKLGHRVHPPYKKGER